MFQRAEMRKRPHDADRFGFQREIEDAASQSAAYVVMPMRL